MWLIAKNKPSEFNLAIIVNNKKAYEDARFIQIP